MSISYLLFSICYFGFVTCHCSFVIVICHWFFFVVLSFVALNIAHNNQLTNRKSQIANLK